MPTAIVVYRKPGCALCDEVDDRLDDLLRGVPEVTVTHVNVLSDTVLFERYRYRVPVIEIGGIERLSLRFDDRELRAALAEAGCVTRE
ncbi:MAG: glutaredoxin family protein [Myxococcaceae bacterium]